MKLEREAGGNFQLYQIELILATLRSRYGYMLAVEDIVIDILTEDVWCRFLNICLEELIF